MEVQMKLSLRILAMLVGACYLTGMQVLSPRPANSLVLLRPAKAERSWSKSTASRSPRPRWTPSSKSASPLDDAATEAQKKELQATAINLLIEDTLMRQ